MAEEEGDRASLIVYNATMSDRTSLTCQSFQGLMNWTGVLEHVKRVCDQGKGADGISSNELLVGLVTLPGDDESSRRTTKKKTVSMTSRVMIRACRDIGMMSYINQVELMVWCRVVRRFMGVESAEGGSFRKWPISCPSRYQRSFCCRTFKCPS